MKTWVEISKKNLVHNLSHITSRLQPWVTLMAVLKSNAYGHGIREVSSILAKYQHNIRNKLWFGVDSMEEASHLQNIPSCISVPILILGYTPYTALKFILKNIRLTVYDIETIKALGKTRKKAVIHLKLETGTRRQGIEVKNLSKFIKYVQQYKNIEVEGISSHFAEAENIADTSLTETQYKLFYDASKQAEQQLGKKLVKHIACSAAASHFPKSHFDMIRAGINLYGLQSINNQELVISNQASELVFNLKPVLAWKTIIAQTKNVTKDMPIGYGRTEKMPYDGQVVVIPVGYWDGFDRGFSGIGEVLIGGTRCRIIGRVCMNMCMALLPQGKKVVIEDEVVLIGSQKDDYISADELAKKIQTINYEIVTRINPLIKRVVV